MQSIALFQTRFSGIDPGRIQVHIRDGHMRGTPLHFVGDFSRIRVRWLLDGSIPSLDPYVAQLPHEYGSLNLELCADKGEGLVSSITLLLTVQ